MSTRFNIDTNTIYKIYLILLLFFVLRYLLERILKSPQKSSNINDKSYQRFAKFFGKIELKDDEFNKKIDCIQKSIKKDKLTDINEIAKRANCSYDECILKIKYLKNKRILGDYYIDVDNGIINPCNSVDKLLLKKYAPFIYKKHSQIDEIVNALTTTTYENFEITKRRVIDELTYLDKKNLLNGINIDLVDEKIIYYTIEKHKKEKDFISQNCPTCGALNDVPRNGKARCEYCNNILENNK